MAVNWYNPNMTGFNAPVPYVASGSAYIAQFTPWRAFVDVPATTFQQGDCWTPGEGKMNAWVQIDFGVPTRISNYRIRVRGQLAAAQAPYTSAPRAWTLQGSNDGVNFTVIDTRSSITNWSAANIWNEFALAQAQMYRYYRVHFTANNGDGTYLCVGKIQFGMAPGKILFQNLTSGKFYTVSGSSAVEVVDGSKATADASGVNTGIVINTNTVSNFKTLIGLPFRVVNYTVQAASPRVIIKENFTGRLSATSMPIGLTGVEDIVTLTAVGTGDIRHAIRFDDGMWLKYDTASSAWVEVATPANGMTTAELNALSIDQFKLLMHGIYADAVAMTLRHTMVTGATLSTVTLKVNMEGETRIAPSTSYTQSFNQGARTITFNILKTGQYSINYVDSL